MIATHLTAANCRSCHEAVYEQFLRSRHAAPSWAAHYGEKGLTAEQIAYSERFHPGGTKRAANPLVARRGPAGKQRAIGDKARVKRLPTALKTPNLKMPVSPRPRRAGDVSDRCNPDQALPSTVRGARLTRGPVSPERQSGALARRWSTSAATKKRCDLVNDIGLSPDERVPST